MLSETNGVPDAAAAAAEKQSSSPTVAYRSVIERYFTFGYQVNLPKLGKKDDCINTFTNFNDVRILRHSNRICLVTLAPSHSLIKQQKLHKISSISFKVTDKLDRSLNKVSGKRKRGAHWLNPTSPLCVVSCENGTKHTIYCGIRGNLVEMNERLLSSPHLLQQAYETEGYIAVVMPKIAEANLIMENLLTESEYQTYVSTNVLAVETKSKTDDDAKDADCTVSPQHDGPTSVEYKS